MSDPLLTLDAAKLIARMLGPCDNGPDEHSWRDCQRCMALALVQDRDPMALRLLLAAETALRALSSSLPSQSAEKSFDWPQWLRFVFLENDQRVMTNETLRELVCAKWDALERPAQPLPQTPQTCAMCGHPASAHVAFKESMRCYSITTDPNSLSQCPCTRFHEPAPATTERA